MRRSAQEAEVERIRPMAWDADDRDLWARILAHEFEPAGVALTFVQRLAREHAWRLQKARDAIDEYRRFAFLAVRAGQDMTPSEEVDEVWHQHLTFSRDYWQVWCRDVLRRELHHGPTLGGPVEARRFADQYAATLGAYEAWFGPPPIAFWPGTAQRFGRSPAYRIVDCGAHLIIPIPRAALRAVRHVIRAFGLGALLAVISPRPAAAAAMLDVLDWTAGPFLTFYVVAAFASLVAAYVLPPRLMAVSQARVDRRQLTPASLGFLAGGRVRAADVLILEDIAAGRVVVQNDTRKRGPFTTRSDSLSVGGQSVTRAWLTSEKSDEINELQKGLAAEGLAFSPPQRRTFGLLTLIIVAPVLFVGLAKVVIGHNRDKPVGFLIVLMIATSIVALALAHRRSRASRAGRALVATANAEHDRAIRAPLADEVISAFAIAGASALAGTAFEAYGRLLQSDSGGSGCSGGGSGCGGSGGGGGCGGCGS